MPDRYVPRRRNLDAPELPTLIYWVKERESIRRRKDAWQEPGPWTTDPIFLKYRFCNVRRRDDRVSQWLCENVLTDSNRTYDLKSFLMFSAWCRFVNWPPTIKAAMDEDFYPKKRIDWRGLGKFLDDLGEKQKVWTGAYMIRAPQIEGMKKGKFVSEVVIGENFKVVLPKLANYLTPQSGGRASFRGTWEQLKTINGYGSFYAGQIAGDWTYTPLLSAANDLKTFAPLGPGSLRGFNRLMGWAPIKKRPPEELWLEKLVEWRAAIISELGPEYESLTALDVQNTLCEVDKYIRVRNSEGRPRANYTPHEY
jgi:hypothetical protein